MNTPRTEMHWLDEHHRVSLLVLSELSGLSVTELRTLTDSGVLQPVEAGTEEPDYRADCVVTARLAGRLRRDLELDMEGLQLVLNLLARVRDLESELAELRARSPSAC